MKTKQVIVKKPGRASTPASQPNNGRGVRRGDSTKLLILNAAERCFAEDGFDGVSLRAITEAAGVDLALVNYHFGSKENLLRQVIGRRAKIVHDDRVLALEEARHQAGTSAPSIEAIVTAFLEPLLLRMMSRDAGWRHYCGLISQLSMVPRFVEITHNELDPTALHFINALRAALPKASPQSVYWGYMFLLGAMIQAMVPTGRIDRLSRGLCRSDDVEGGLRQMVPFVCAGLRAIAK
ncbi:MAG TPA: TetR/AcrR family transcriptional regulator [Stellaceae bacterium]